MIPSVLCGKAGLHARAVGMLGRLPCAPANGLRMPRLGQQSRRPATPASRTLPPLAPGPIPYIDPLYPTLPHSCQPQAHHVHTQELTADRLTSPADAPPLLSSIHPTSSDAWQPLPKHPCTFPKGFPATQPSMLGASAPFFLFHPPVFIFFPVLLNTTDPLRAESSNRDLTMFLVQCERTLPSLHSSFLPDRSCRSVTLLFPTPLRNGHKTECTWKPHP